MGSISLPGSVIRVAEVWIGMKRELVVSVVGLADHTGWVEDLGPFSSVSSVF